jgi:Ca-activated chloride channel family protein
VVESERMRYWLISSLLSALAIVFLSGSVAAQTTLESPAESAVPVVNIPFFAEDGHGPQRKGITSADLTILDDGRAPRWVTAIRTASDTPLRLGILIDTSSSERTSGLYRLGLPAISELVPRLLTGNADRVFVVTFASIPEATPFMDREAFLKFRTNARPGGGTAFFDAVYLASKDRMQPDPTQPARRVLIILTDGGDNQSHVDHNKAIEAAQEAGAVIFAVSTSEVGSGIGAGGLVQFADKTGGHAFFDLSTKDIPKVFRDIQEQIENMYVVSYVPQEYAKQGERRSVELKATSDKKLKFRAPKSYYVSRSIP